MTSPSPVQETSRQDELAPLYNLVLLDDDDHTYDYVIEMLMKLFFKTADEAYHHAVEVDTARRTIVLSTDLPTAEFGRDQIHAYGADWRMPRSKGSMSALVEPAAG